MYKYVTLVAGIAFLGAAAFLWGVVERPRISEAIRRRRNRDAERGDVGAPLREPRE